MISTKLILKINKIDATGKAPISLRITKNRKSVYVRTGIKVEPLLWQEAKQSLKSQYPNSLMANARLKSFITKAEAVALELEKHGKFYSSKLVKEKMTDANADNLVLYAYEWVERRKERRILTFSSYVKYKGVIQKLDNFCKGEMRIDEFSPEFIERYEVYLRTVCNNHTNTIASNLSCLRALANTLIEEDRIKLNNHPFRRYHFKFEDTQRGFLTTEQLEKIERQNYKWGTRLRKSKDIFLFCSQTGLRIGDALHLKKENYTGTHLVYHSQKTKEYETLKLTKKANQIIEPYVMKTKHSTSYVFPFLNAEAQTDEETALQNQKSATSLINNTLKIICKDCEFDFNVSSHYGRHSLASNALNKGLSLEEIKAILGHSDVRTTQIYAKAVNAMKDNAIDKLNN